MPYPQFIYTLWSHTTGRPHKAPTPSTPCMWQDPALSLINFIFIATVLPALILNYKTKNTQGQSLIMYLSTALLLILMAAIFYTLGLVWSMISTLGNAFVWSILTAQRLRYNQHPGRRP